VGTATKPLFARNPELLCEDLGDSMLLLDVAGGKVMELNRNAARLWRRLENAASAEDLVETLARAHPDTDQAVLVRDVAEFLRATQACRAVTEIRTDTPE
jgi:hypothetical protein